MIYASLSGGVTTVRHRRGHLGTVEPTPSQERRRIDGVVDGVTRTRGRCFVMASMMDCFDVFSSLSINLSMASRLAMQTSHSFGSALAFAAAAVASATRQSVRRSMLLIGGCGVALGVSIHLFDAMSGRLGCKLSRSLRRVTFLLQVFVGRGSATSGVRSVYSTRRYARVSCCTDDAVAVRKGAIKSIDKNARCRQTLECL